MLNSPAVGFLGGSFDPVHTGHVHIARALRDEMQLDEVRLVPLANAVHRDGVIASAENRLAMCQLATAHEPGLQVDDCEILRGGPSYTVDTLAAKRAELGPTAPIVFLLGSDSLQQLSTWRNWRRIMVLAHLAVAVRPGFNLSCLDTVLASYLQERWQKRSARPVVSVGTITLLAAKPLAISATDIRADLAAGQDVRNLAPDVAHYIRTHRLYGVPHME